MEERVLEAVSVLAAKIDGMDLTLEVQKERLDQVQAKVDMSTASLGQVQQDQEILSQIIRRAVQPQLQNTTDEVPGLRLEDPFASLTVEMIEGKRGTNDGNMRRHWTPKMDFSKFDGSDVGVWVDQFLTYFDMYQIHDNFQVSAASLNLVGKAANWYKVWKQSVGRHNWTAFSLAVMKEFEGNYFLICYITT